MATGKTWKEVTKPSVTRYLGKWSGTRRFQVTTSSPSVAILTIQEDAGIPPGTSWTEGADADYAGADTSTIKMRSANYETAVLSQQTVEVVVRYEDSRYTLDYDETSRGFVREYYKYGSTTEQVYQSLYPISAYDVNNLSVPFTPTVTMQGSSAVIKDRSIGYDGETVSGTQIEVPQLIYGELWRLNNDESGTWSASSSGDAYIPGIYEEIDWTTRCTDADCYFLCKRLGITAWSPGSPLTIPYWIALFATVGTINSDEWRDFQPGSLLMQPPQIQQVGLVKWMCNFEFAFSPGYFYDAATGLEDPEIYIEGSEVQALDKRGWDYMWYKYKDNTANQIIERISVGQVYHAFRFAALGLLPQDEETD